MAHPLWHCASLSNGTDSSPNTSKNQTSTQPEHTFFNRMNQMSNRTWFCMAKARNTSQFKNELASRATLLSITSSSRVARPAFRNIMQPSLSTRSKKSKLCRAWQVFFSVRHFYQLENDIMISLYDACMYHNYCLLLVRLMNHPWINMNYIMIFNCASHLRTNCLGHLLNYLDPWGKSIQTQHSKLWRGKSTQEDLYGNLFFFHYHSRLLPSSIKSWPFGHIQTMWAWSPSSVTLKAQFTTGYPANEACCQTKAVIYEAEFFT